MTTTYRAFVIAGLLSRIDQTSGTNGGGAPGPGTTLEPSHPYAYGGGEPGIGDDTKPSRDLVCESFEEILGIDPIFAEGCAPCVHIVGISSGFIVR